MTLPSAGRALRLLIISQHTVDAATLLPASWAITIAVFAILARRARHFPRYWHDTYARSGQLASRNSRATFLRADIERSAMIIDFRHRPNGRAAACVRFLAGYFLVIGFWEFIAISTRCRLFCGALPRLSFSSSAMRRDDIASSRHASIPARAGRNMTDEEHRMTRPARRRY